MDYLYIDPRAPPHWVDITKPLTEEMIVQILGSKSGKVTKVPIDQERVTKIQCFPLDCTNFDYFLWIRDDPLDPSTALYFIPDGNLFAKIFTSATIRGPCLLLGEPKAK
jgi:hypothetical protein